MRHLTRAIALALATWTAACGGGSSGATPTQPSAPVFQIPSGVGAPRQSMFQTLPTYLVSARTDMQNLLPRNPQSAAQINAKIALLQRPNLAAEMSNGRTFVEGSVLSSSGRTIRIGALFPEERMRADAMTSVRRIEQALPILERFTGTAFPSSAISLWYGFVVGNSGVCRRGARINEGAGALEDVEDHVLN